MSLRTDTKQEIIIDGYMEILTSAPLLWMLLLSRSNFQN